MVYARKRFGQHFLEPAWADKVVGAIVPAPSDMFLEIGAGRGILTLRLAPKVDRLVAVEIDRDLIAGLAPKLPPNASIVEGDVLQIDLSSILPDREIRVAGNLPYNVSSPIIFRLFELHTQRRLIDATLMLQLEVANRIAARPGTADYGILGILTQWRAEVTRLLTLPPGAFRPPPDVRSALIRLTFRPPSPPVRDRMIFEGLVRAVFTQRRKTLANALAPFAAKTAVAARPALEAAGIDPTRRPETLEIVEMARLADAFTPDDR